MGTVSATQVEERIRSAFPEGAIEQVQVLTHGDDPAVGPGETAVRVFLSRAGRPEGPEADKEILTTLRLGGPAPLASAGWPASCPSSSGSSSARTYLMRRRVSPRCRALHEVQPPRQRNRRRQPR